MSTPAKPSADILKRISPIVAKISAASLKAWLKTRDLTSTAATKGDLVNRVATLIQDGELEEKELEGALIGFEEASGKRIYLFDIENLPPGQTMGWLLKNLSALSIPHPTARVLAGHRPKPMSPVYSEFQGDILRVKWSEEHSRVRLDSHDKPVSKPIPKRIVFIADLKNKLAELRLDPPENRHTYEDANGRATADAYYAAYRRRAAEVLGAQLNKTEVAGVIKSLVEEETPRVVRIHIDNHTNQKDSKWNVKSSRKDVRDDPEWRNAYNQYGATWAWDSQSFYWFRTPSGDGQGSTQSGNGSTKKRPTARGMHRELFSHLDAREGFLKVNANCSDDEVEYVVSQIRAR